MGSVINMKKQHWEEAFEDWEKLLDRAHARDMLEDPKAIWDEAWRQASMIATSIVQHNQEAKPIDIAILLERKLLK